MWNLKNDLVICVFTLFTLLVFAGQVQSEEKILSFDSMIEVHEDASMTVTETIKVRAEGNEIKRGIYRDFPTRYTTKSGRRHRIPFDVQRVRRDGRPEPHFTESIEGGVRLYIGEEDDYIDEGVYTYEITYRTNRTIGFFEHHDELYWNVTGNHWAFPIEQARVTVRLPEPVETDRLQVDGYTGYEGSTGDAYRVTKRREQVVSMDTTKRLQSRQGFTIAIGWPKGVVQEPTRMERLYYLISDYLAVILGLFGFVIVSFYYLWAWLRAGVDPEKGTIIPRYEPPDGISPSATRYVMQLGFDDEAYTTALVNLGVKGYVNIEEENGDYTVTKTADPDEALSDGEQALMKELFEDRDEVELEQSNHEEIRSSMEALEDELEDGYRKTFFFQNLGYVAGGIGLSVVCLFGTAYFGADSIAKETLFLLGWLTGWTIGTGALLKKAYDSWTRFFRKSGFSHLTSALSTTAFSIPFVVFWVVPFIILYENGGWTYLVIVLLYGLLNVLFYVLMKAPTVQGRKLMDKLEGLRRYMRVAEKDRLNLDELPERTPELFERLLPYAIALGVGNAWARSFTDVLEQAGEDGGYRPGWYHGPHHHTDTLTSNLSASLSSTIASSSTAPGSSSGIGGGGAGGGAGGGGGGGW